MCKIFATNTKKRLYCFLVLVPKFSVHSLKFYLPQVKSASKMKYNKGFKRIFVTLKSIRTFNVFWSKYITCFLTLYGFEVCYIFFTVVTTKTWIEKMQLFPSFLLVSGFALYIYVISVNCSKIYQNNVNLHRCVRRMMMRVIQAKHSNLRDVGMNYNQTSFEHYFRYTGFRLINGSRINNRMF